MCLPISPQIYVNRVLEVYILSIYQCIARARKFQIQPSRAIALKHPCVADSSTGEVQIVFTSCCHVHELVRRLERIDKSMQVISSPGKMANTDPWVSQTPTAKHPQKEKEDASYILPSGQRHASMRNEVTMRINHFTVLQ